MTNSMREAMNKAMAPRMAVRLDTLGRREKDNINVIEICNNVLKYKYETMLDRKEMVIYVGKRI